MTATQTPTIADPEAGAVHLRSVCLQAANNLSDMLEDGVKKHRDRLIDLADTLRLAAQAQPTPSRDKRDDPLYLLLCEIDLWMHDKAEEGSEGDRLHAKLHDVLHDFMAPSRGESGAREAVVDLIRSKSTPWKGYWHCDPQELIDAVLALAFPEQDALEGYRAAVAWIGADSWDGCTDCIEILKAARCADVAWDWAGDSDRVAAALKRIRAFAGSSELSTPIPTGEGALRSAIEAVQSDIADLEGEHEVMAGRPITREDWSINVKVVHLDAILRALAMGDGA